MSDFKWTDELRETRRAMVAERRSRLKVLAKAETLTRQIIADLRVALGGASLDDGSIDEHLSLKELRGARDQIDVEVERLKPDADLVIDLKGKEADLGKQQQVVAKQVADLKRHMAAVEALTVLRRIFLKAESSDGKVQFPAKWSKCQPLLVTLIQEGDVQRERLADITEDLHRAEAASERVSTLLVLRDQTADAVDSLAGAVDAEDEEPILDYLARETLSNDEMLERLRQRVPAEDIQTLIVETQERLATEAAQREKEQERRDSVRRAAAKRQVARLAKSIAEMEQKTKGSARRLEQLQERLDKTEASIERKIGQLVEKMSTRDYRGPADIRREILKSPARFPAIDNLLAKRNDLTKLIHDLRALDDRLNKARSKLEIAANELAGLSVGQRGRTGPRKVVLEWSQAESLARDYMAWLGFADARVTQRGADGGVDVVSRKAVAQVKMHNKGTGRPDVQQLFGIAAAERKLAVFFAFSYTADALAWARTHSVALFRFARSGEVVPATPAARTLLSAPSDAG